MTGKISVSHRQQNPLIPHKVALLVEKEDSETKPFHISYETYNKKICQIKDLKGNQAKKALGDMVLIGEMFSIDNFQSNNIQTIPIKNTGEYKKLYSRLPEDIDLKENKIGSTARMFYYRVDRVIYIVAFTSTHLETDKNRK